MWTIINELTNYRKRDEKSKENKEKEEIYQSICLVRSYTLKEREKSFVDITTF